jgi:hypothetical protein
MFSNRDGDTVRWLCKSLDGLELPGTRCEGEEVSRTSTPMVSRPKMFEGLVASSQHERCPRPTGDDRGASRPAGRVPSYFAGVSQTPGVDRVAKVQLFDGHCHAGRVRVDVLPGTRRARSTMTATIVSAPAAALAEKQDLAFQACSRDLDSLHFDHHDYGPLRFGHAATASGGLPDSHF